MKNEPPVQEILWQLHLRKAKGELLTDEEQQRLAAWYDQQEQKERTGFQFASTPAQVEPLQVQIDAILTQIAATTTQLQQLALENRQLRQEITRLEHQLAQKSSLQPA